eukprot:gene1280-1398_t
MGCTSSSNHIQERNEKNETGLVLADKPVSLNDSSTPKDNAAPELPHTFTARYKLGDVLGEGGYSIVKLGISNVDKKKVAVKIVAKNGLSRADEESLREEVKILSALTHPNIVRAYDFFEEEKSFYVILEYLDGGELFDRIVKKTFYNEKEARDLVVILLRALKYLHDRNIVHRDLKPENLLMTSKDDDANVKLADFGFAAECTECNLTVQCGTPGYIAPEIISGKPYGKPVDMWSFGVIFYILLGGYPPFQDDNEHALMRKITRGEYQFHKDYWGSVSDEAKDLIRGLLTVDMNQRLTIDQALSHSWVKAADETLAARNLESNLAELRKYQATRKLRAGVKAVIAINRMRNLVGSQRSNDSSKLAKSKSDEDTVEGDDTSRI